MLPGLSGYERKLGVYDMYDTTYYYSGIYYILLWRAYVYQHAFVETKTSHFFRWPCLLLPLVFFFSVTEEYKYTV